MKVMRRVAVVVIITMLRGFENATISNNQSKISAQSVYDIVSMKTGGRGAL